MKMSALGLGVLLVSLCHSPAQVTVDHVVGKGCWLKVVMSEGRKRQIREVGSRIGLPVQRIVRVRIGTLLLGDLKPREWRNLTRDEVKRLKSLSSAVKQTRGTKPGTVKKFGASRRPRSASLGERRLK